MTKLVDRRVQRTRKLLRDALMELIIERGYDELSIRDITDRANVGRATFYLHFRNKEELLLAQLQEVVSELIARLQASDPPPVHPIGARSRPLFEHVAQNRAPYQVLLSSRGSVKLAKYLRDTMAGQMQARLQKAALPSILTSVPIEVVARYLTGALLELVIWWLEKGEAYSAAQMAEMFERLAQEGLGTQAPPVLDGDSLPGTEVPTTSEVWPQLYKQIPGRP